jgi:hypothetical protein
MPLFRPNMMYDPQTASTVLAIEMVADIRNAKSMSHPQNPLAHPLHLMSEQAWHGGGWNSPFTADSTGVAAYLCYLTKKFLPLLVVTLGAAAYFRQPLFKLMGTYWPYLATVGFACLIYKKLTKK